MAKARALEEKKLEGAVVPSLPKQFSVEQQENPKKLTDKDFKDIYSDHEPLITTLPISIEQPKEGKIPKAPIKMGTWNVLDPKLQSGFGASDLNKGHQARAKRIADAASTIIQKQNLNIFQFQEFFGKSEELLEAVRNKNPGGDWVILRSPGKSGDLLSIYDRHRLELNEASLLEDNSIIERLDKSSKEQLKRESKETPSYTPEGIITLRFKIAGSTQELPPFHNVHLSRPDGIEAARKYLVDLLNKKDGAILVGDFNFPTPPSSIKSEIKIEHTPTSYIPPAYTGGMPKGNCTDGGFIRIKDERMKIEPIEVLPTERVDVTGNILPRLTGDAAIKQQGNRPDPP